MNKEYDLHKALRPFFPEPALDDVVALVGKTPVQIVLTDPRASRYGDYRSPIKSAYHRITMNVDLNKYAFLITFIHEFAHLLTFQQYGGKVQAHGKEWKDIYKNLMQPFIQKNVFPEDLQIAVIHFFKNLKASSGRDVNLMRILEKYNVDTSVEGEVTIETIPSNAVFQYKEQFFQKLKKDRIYYRCKDLRTESMYKFHPLTKVIPSNN